MEQKNWDKLSMNDRAAYIQIAVKSGLRDLRDIKEFYNTYSKENPTNRNKYDGISEESNQMNRINYYDPITGRNYGSTMPEGKVRITSFNDLTPKAQDEYRYNHPTNLPEVVVEPNKSYSFMDNLSQGYNNFEDTFGISGKDAVSFVPYVGDALDLYDIGDDLNKGNYLSAGIGIGALLLPNIIEKPLKMIFRKGKNLIRRYNKARHYEIPYHVHNSYIDNREAIINDYIQKYGDIQGGTAKDRARGLKEALELKDREIKKAIPAR